MVVQGVCICVTLTRVTLKARGKISPFSCEQRVDVLFVSTRIVSATLLDVIEGWLRCQRQCWLCYPWGYRLVVGLPPNNCLNVSVPDVDHEHGQSQVKSLQLRAILSGPERKTRGSDLIG